MVGKPLFMKSSRPKVVRASEGCRIADIVVIQQKENSMRISAYYIKMLERVVVIRFSCGRKYIQTGVLLG